jgi:hypothetical protein
MSPRRLILHVGLPKTGSTALQSWCYKRRENLSQRGITYPESDNNLIAPKHQFMVSALMRNDMAELRAHLVRNETETLVLSTEGLTNHFYDFPSAALKAFREAVSLYNVFVFMVVRNKGAWTKSYYKQAVINPPIVEYNYATPLSYSEFSQLSRVQRLAEHSKLRTDIATAFAAHEVIVANYEEDWMETFLDCLGIADMHEFTRLEKKNISVSDDLVEIIRQINAMGLPSEKRAGILAAIANCFQTKHGVLKSYRFVQAPDHRVFESLRALNSEQANMIAKLLAWSPGPEPEAPTNENWHD